MAEIGVEKGINKQKSVRCSKSEYSAGVCQNSKYEG
jgi:hypothetical protein